MTIRLDNLEVDYWCKYCKVSKRATFIYTAVGEAAFNFAVHKNCPICKNTMEIQKLVGEKSNGYV